MTDTVVVKRDRSNVSPYKAFSSSLAPYISDLSFSGVDYQVLPIDNKREVSYLGFNQLTSKFLSR